MLVAELDSAETSARDVAEDVEFTRGLLCAVALCLPLWGVIIGMVRSVF